MTVCVISLNGFLQILDLKIYRLPWLLRIGQLPRWRVIRAVAQHTGAWTLFTADGEQHDVLIEGCWVLGRGSLLGLRWRTATGRSLYALTSIRLQERNVGRRLLVRLRWPLPEPVVLA